VPRDASAQQRAAAAVPLGTERPGDLYFFAGGGEEIDHVGFVTGDGEMLHASESTVGHPAGEGSIEEVPLTAGRRESLVCAARFLPR
jgi:cell wall-associated NlpC family hydrolase